MKSTNTSWVIIGLGAAVAAVGAGLLKGSLGAGVTGFGLAHVVLGGLDRFRPSVRNDS